MHIRGKNDRKTVSAVNPLKLRSWLGTLLAAAIAAVCLQMLHASCAVADGGCKNEAIRLEQASRLNEEPTFLPECRAYELVSPGSSPYLENLGSAEGARASVFGGAIAYFTHYPAKEATRSGSFYLAVRGTDGWSTAEVAPQDSPQGANELSCLQGVYFSADLSQSVLADGWNAEEEKPGESYCQSSEQVLTPNAPVGFGNLYLREGLAESYQLINLTPSGASGDARLEDATDDLSHVLFGENAKLTLEAPAGYNLYEWAGGAVHLVTFLPHGEPTVGKLADGGSHTGAEGVYEGHRDALAPATHAVSANGERVFFYAEHEGIVNLYLRVNATQSQSEVVGSKVNGEQCTEPTKACTIEIDASHGVGASGGGVFWAADQRGEAVFFADENKLVPGAGATAGRPDLYEYNLEAGLLKDLTPEALSGGPANARGLSGAAEDGSYLYFVARSKLTGTQQNSNGSIAQADEPNLYLYHNETLTFIATLRGEVGHSATEEDFEDWQEEAQHGAPNDGFLDARVSPSGQYIGFTSVNELMTGESNVDALTEKRDKEVYLYNAIENALVCLSCDVPPIGNTTLPRPSRFVEEKPFGQPVYLSRNVLDDGQVFFTTPNSLAAQDENGVDDVYEYNEGRLSLISTGTSSGGSTFYDASESGSEVFFVTAQGLVRRDTDNNDSLYDARIEGGFAEPAPLLPCDSAESCRSATVAALSLVPPATSQYKGAGNVTSVVGPTGLKHSRKCKKGRVRRHRKCVKVPRARHRGRKGK